MCGDARWRCYTQNFPKTGGSDVEGTYVWMQFLPFEEADTNPALQAYVDSVGADNVDVVRCTGVAGRACCSNT